VRAFRVGDLDRGRSIARRAETSRGNELEPYFATLLFQLVPDLKRLVASD
jgi:hypothetical protein